MGGRGGEEGGLLAEKEGEGKGDERKGRLVRRAEAAGVVPEMRRSLKLLADLNQELVEERRLHLATQGALAQKDLGLVAKDKYASRMDEQTTRLQQQLRAMEVKLQAARDQLVAQEQESLRKQEQQASASNARLSRMAQNISLSSSKGPQALLPLATEIESTLTPKSGFPVGDSPPSEGGARARGGQSLVLHMRSPDASPDAKGQLVEALQAKVEEQHAWGSKAWGNIQRLNDRIVELETERDALRTQLTAVTNDLVTARRICSTAEAQVSSLEQRYRNTHTHTRTHTHARALARTHTLTHSG